MMVEGHGKDFLYEDRSGGYGDSMPVYGSGVSYIVSLVDDELAPLAADLHGSSLEVVHVNDDLSGLPFEFKQQVSLVHGVTKNDIQSWVLECKEKRAREDARKATPTITPIPVEEEAAQYVSDAMAEAMGYAFW